MEFNFYDTLTRIMLEQGIKKTDIIRDLNISKNSFFFWKKNGNIPNGDTLKKLSDYLKVSIDVLAGSPEAERDPGIKKDPSDLEGFRERTIEFFRRFDSLPDDYQEAIIAYAEWYEARKRSQLRQEEHPEDRKDQ